MVAPLRSCIPSWFDRKDEWNKCIVQAMGYEWIGEEDEKEKLQNDSEATTTNTFQVLNLLNVDDDDEEEHPNNDSTFASSSSNPHQDLWMESAERIQHDIDHMAKWIRERLQYSLARVDLPVDEATLVSSTVTSFCASTAKEIETLRQLTQQSQQQQQQQQHDEGDDSDAATAVSQSIRHRSGIVQILLGRLQEQVVEPFAKLQKQRQRKAIDLWQHPLQCRWSRGRSSDSRHQNSSSSELADQRFLPGKVPPPQELYDFLAKYKQTEKIPTSFGANGPPVSKLFSNNAASSSAKTDTTNPQATKAKPSGKWGRTTSKQPTAAAAAAAPAIPPAVPSAYDPDEDYYATPREELQREAALLLVQMEQSDLDSVQKMEERMVEITTLLTQFASLLTEQQEDIVQIHEATKSSQENLIKGKESLVDATERTKRSKHYMATLIAVLAVLLWFWNSLKP